MIKTVLPALSLILEHPFTTPTPHLQPVSTPAHGGALGGAFWVRSKCRALTPLPGRGGAPGSGMITELGALSSDSTPNTHNPLLRLLYASVNSWNVIKIFAWKTLFRSNRLFSVLFLMPSSEHSIWIGMTDCTLRSKHPLLWLANSCVCLNAYILCTYQMICKKRQLW